MAEVIIKKVVLSQVVEDLSNGMTRWKTDDIGFGSLEKKYNLQRSEMIELCAHPKIKNVETKIPTFIIVDDIEEVLEEVQPLKTKVEVAQPKTTVVKPQKPVKAFI